ncbi:MAG: DUF4349 domain-containing protein [Bacteroidota bacterium]
MKKSILCLPILLLVFGCKDQAATADEAMMVTEVSLKSPAIASYKKMDSNAEANMEAPPAPSQIETKIIKNANLKFESEDINGSFVSIQKAVSNYQATISNDASGKDYNSTYRNLTIRIPNKHFDAFIDTISQGVKHFDTKEISQQDVTEEYIDIESRMKSKKKLEERYLQLLGKANKVSEMLEIEKKLAEIREEIEAKEGQLKYMQNRVSLSTITIEMYTNNPSESGATVSYGGKIWNSIKSGFNELSNFVLSMISIWPLILIFVGSFFFIRRRFFKKKA